MDICNMTAEARVRYGYIFVGRSKSPWLKASATGVFRLSDIRLTTDGNHG
jgi:hypothetical protein